MGTADGIALLCIATLAWIGMLSARGSYWPSVTLRRGYQALAVVGAGTWAWVTVQLGASWLKVTVPFESRLVMGLSLPVTLTGLILFRLVIVRFLARRVYLRQSRGPVLVLGGDGVRWSRLVTSLERDLMHRRLILRPISAMSAGRVASLIAEFEVGEVVVETGVLPASQTLSIAFACLDAAVEVRLIPATSRGGSGLNGDRVGHLPSMRMRRFDLAGPEVLFKRAVDVIGSAVGLLLLSPAFLAIALAVRLNSRGPVIYCQERVGHRGRRFRMFKFRTMVHGNDSREYETYLRSFIRHGKPARIAKDGTKIYKPPDDPRVTAVGAWLRRLSLDELPQLFNTLRGDMSLVGPRPCLPYEWELYEPWQRRRLDVTPGCTGLWQVKGRSRVRFEDMVVLDLSYAHQGTLLSDLRLIVQTIPVMASGRGAY